MTGVRCPKLAWPFLTFIFRVFQCLCDPFLFTVVRLCSLLELLVQRRRICCIRLDCRSARPLILDTLASLGYQSTILGAHGRDQLHPC